MDPSEACMQNTPIVLNAAGVRQQARGSSCVKLTDECNPLQEQGNAAAAWTGSNGKGKNGTVHECYRKQLR